VGKVRVVSNLGAGQYTVDVIYDNAKAEALDDKLRVERDRLVLTEIPALEVAEAAEQAKVDAQAAVVNSAITAWIADPTPENRKAIDEAQAELAALSIELAAAKRARVEAEARALAITKRRQWLKDYSYTDVRKNVWCIDLSDGVGTRTGFEPDDELGCIEVSGSEDTGIVIKAGYGGKPTYVEADDGKLTPPASMDPYGEYYNKAMFPGWQKWQYQYKVGAITADNGDGTFTVQLDNTYSPEQNPTIKVNNIVDAASPNDRQLTNVPASYMECNSGAFEVNDRVVVRCQNIGTPSESFIIIGFESYPKECSTGEFNYQLWDNGNSIHGWQNVDKSTGSWVMTEPATSDLITDFVGNFDSARGVLSRGYNIDTVNKTWDTVSWGYLSGRGVYINGSRVATRPTSLVSSYGFAGVMVTDDLNYIWAIFTDTNSFQTDVVIGRKTTTAELTGALYDAQTAPNGWELQTLTGDAYRLDRNSEWVFNDDVTEARGFVTYTAGQARTPPQDPGAGAEWHNTAGTHREENRITITSPKAATIAQAGVSFSNQGRQGDIYVQIRSKDYRGSGDVYDASGDGCLENCCFYQDHYDENYYSEVWSGSYTFAVGWHAGQWVYARLEGRGSMVQDIDHSARYSIDFPSVDGDWANFKDSYVGKGGVWLVIPHMNIDVEYSTMEWNSWVVPETSVFPMAASSQTWWEQRWLNIDKGLTPCWLDMTDSISYAEQYRQVYDVDRVRTGTPSSNSGTSTTYSHRFSRAEVRAGSAALEISDWEDYYQNDSSGPSDMDISFFSQNVGWFACPLTDPSIFSDTDTTTLYNITEGSYPGDSLESQTSQNRTLPDAHGAKSPGGAYCLSWYVNLGSNVYDEYLTGGNLDSLDGKSWPDAFYKYIHPG